MGKDQNGLLLQKIENESIFWPENHRNKTNTHISILNPLLFLGSRDGQNIYYLSALKNFPMTSKENGFCPGPDFNLTRSNFLHFNFARSKYF